MHAIAVLLDGIRTRWRDHRRNVADWQELQSCDPCLVAGMASDLNLSANEFERVATHSAGSDRLMEGMMAAFRLDGADLEEGSPALLREAQLTCARCSAKKRCARELAAGTAFAHADNFCPNADLFAIFGRR